MNQITTNIHQALNSFYSSFLTLVLCSIMKTDPSNHNFIELYHFLPLPLSIGQDRNFISDKLILIHSMQKQQGGFFFIVQNIFLIIKGVFFSWFLQSLHFK